MFKEQYENLKRIWQQLDDLSADLCDIADELDKFNYSIIKDSEEFERYLTNEGLMNPKLRNAIKDYMKYYNN